MNFQSDTVGKRATERILPVLRRGIREKIGWLKVRQVLRGRPMTRTGLIWLLIAMAVAAGCQKNPVRGRAAAAPVAALVGAGDIADCRDLAGAEATAKLLEKIPGTVMAVGDLAYPDG